MGWLKLGLFGSIIFGLYYFQQIKMTLKSKGYNVQPFSGWIDDYRQFKGLILKEPDQRLKAQYQGIINGLHLSLGGLGVFIILLLSGN